MTTAETKEFLKKIKAHYQEFKCDEVYIVKEWIESLLPYSKEDVYEKFKDHLNNEYTQKEVPKIQVLIKWLIPEYDKRRKHQPIAGYLPCRWCGKRCNNTEILSIHEEFCLRKRYFTRLFKKLSINAEDFFKDFSRVSLEELNEQYDKIIIRIIEEEKKQHKLSNFEKEGLKAYYNNVLNKRFG